ncbi:hypothetical protein B0H16DRAFT_1473346 [Mycena metata]|uniref:Uncharacterized protein n=1 Tax=Mycena metata TaxID=1033252 RepID=A0AAD7HL67_9AGAR|nr:hypothetical protein B0H16DRAFT_1473346 [Mycena metata]
MVETSSESKTQRGELIPPPPPRQSAMDGRLFAAPSRKGSKTRRAYTRTWCHVLSKAWRTRTLQDLVSILTSSTTITRFLLSKGVYEDVVPCPFKGMEEPMGVGEGWRIYLASYLSASPIHGPMNLRLFLRDAFTVLAQAAFRSLNPRAHLIKPRPHTTCAQAKHAKRVKLNNMPKMKTMEEKSILYDQTNVMPSPLRRKNKTASKVRPPPSPSPKTTGKRHRHQTAAPVSYNTERRYCVGTHQTRRATFEQQQRLIEPALENRGVNYLPNRRSVAATDDGGEAVPQHGRFQCTLHPPSSQTSFHAPRPSPSRYHGAQMFNAGGCKVGVRDRTVFPATSTFAPVLEDGSPQGYEEGEMDIEAAGHTGRGRCRTIKTEEGENTHRRRLVRLARTRVSYCSNRMGKTSYLSLRQALFTTQGPICVDYDMLQYTISAIVHGRVWK